MNTGTYKARIEAVYGELFNRAFAVTGDYRTARDALNEAICRFALKDAPKGRRAFVSKARTQVTSCAYKYTGGAWDYDANSDINKNVLRFFVLNNGMGIPEKKALKISGVERPDVEYEIRRFSKDERRKMVKQALFSRYNIPDFASSMRVLDAFLEKKSEKKQGRGLVGKALGLVAVIAFMAVVFAVASIVAPESCEESPAHSPVGETIEDIGSDDRMIEELEPQ